MATLQSVCMYAISMYIFRYRQTHTSLCVYAYMYVCLYTKKAEGLMAQLTT